MKRLPWKAIGQAVGLTAAVACAGTAGAAGVAAPPAGAQAAGGAVPVAEVMPAPRGGIKTATRVENNGAGIYHTPPAYDPEFAEAMARVRSQNKKNFREYPAGGEGVAIDAAVLNSPETEPPSGATEAPGDFRVWRNQSLDPDIGGVAGMSDRSGEPSFAQFDDRVFYTGNWYAARSSNRGIDWTYVNPYDNFPANGVNDVPPGAGTFCCDQVVIYSPGWDTLVWLLQYNQAAGGGNVQRLAIANGTDDIDNNNWFFYDFDAANFGFPATNWLDYPDIMVSNTRLFVSTNVFTSGGSYAGSVVWSMALSEISTGASAGYWYYAPNVGTIRLCQGSTINGFFGYHNNNTQIRLWEWLGDNTAASTWDINHNAFPTGAMTATGPGGCNWAGFADSRILGAARGGGEIAFMWNARQDPGNSRPFPFTRTLRINESTKAVIAEGDIWNSTFAWLYPSATSNIAGNMGGSIAYGGGSFYPSSAVWLADNYNSRSLSNPSTGFVDQGSVCQSTNRWGDYYTARRSSMGSESFLASSFANDANGVQARFTWFGREEDIPAFDLQNQSVAAPAGTFDPEDTFTTTVTVQNIGAQATPGNVTVDVYASTNTIISTGDTLIGSFTRASVGVGTTFTANINCTLPLAIAANTYYIGAIVTTASDGYTPNNTNLDATPITVRRIPDIAATSITAPDGIWYIGQPVPGTIEARWQNIGYATAVNYDWEARASPNTTISTADKLIESRTDTFGAAQGASRTWFAAMSVPSDALPGTYYIGFRIDTTTITQITTANDTAFDPVTVQFRYCEADVNSDGNVDLADFFEFFGCYDLTQPCADIDGFPGVDLGDFFFFFGAYDTGCNNP